MVRDLRRGRARVGERGHAGRGDDHRGARGSAAEVVATAVGGVPDVVDEGETGFLVPQGDTQALAERLQVLALDPARRAAMGEAGRDRVLGRYAVERLVGDVDALYRELLGNVSSSTRRR